METGIENEEPVEEVIKLISAKDIRAVEAKDTREDVVSKAVDKTCEILCQFAKTAQESGSGMFKIPTNIVRKYIKNFEPRAEMLCLTDDIYQDTISDMIDLGYDLKEDLAQLLTVSWADDSV